MKEIASLTATSILEEEIFAEIFNIEDEFVQAATLLTITDQAKAVGVKAKFETMYKAYKKKHDKQAKETKPEPVNQNNGCMTEFEGKYPQMFCGSWIANENGVVGVNQLGMPITACYHPILPVQRLINIDSEKEKIKIAFKKGKRWKEVTVDKGVIASSNRIVGLSDYGVSVTSENARNLVRYLADIENYNINLIGTQLSTSKLGWVQGDFMPYGKNIMFDGELKFKDAYESIHEQGSFDTWLELAREVRKSNRFEPKIYLVGSLASVLLEPLNALPFIINVWGDTGKGKTVALMLGTSCWANPGENNYITDPKSTVTALELRLDFLNNLPMFIDDMSQVKEKNGGDFTGLVYMLCSGKGKDRANTTLGLNKSTTWKNIIMTNYEYSLVTETMQGGAINRIIDIEMGDGYIFENGNQVVETIKQNYGFAGRAFIDAVNQIGVERIKELQKKAYAAIVKRASELGVEKEEKQILPMSILLTADKIATEHIFEDGQYLDFNTCVDLLKNKGEVSENERAYDFIMNEVTINISKFVPDPTTGQYKGETWGLIENGYAVINKNIFDRICDRGNFSSKSFLSWASKKNLIESAKGRNTKQKRVANSLGWYVFLKLSDDTIDEQGFIRIPEDMQEELPFV